MSEKNSGYTAKTRRGVLKNSNGPKSPRFPQYLFLHTQLAEMLEELGAGRDGLPPLTPKWLQCALRASRKKRLAAVQARQRLCSLAPASPVLRKLTWTSVLILMFARRVCGGGESVEWLAAIGLHLVFVVAHSCRESLIMQRR